jgi:WD40 repeat protein
VNNITLTPSHASPVTALAFSSDHSFLASCSNDGYVNLWSPNTDWTLLLHLNNWATCSAIIQLPNSQLAASSYNITIFWDVFNNVAAPIKTLTFHAGPILTLALSPDGSLAASGAQGGSIAFWNYTSQYPFIKYFQAHNNQVRALVFVSNQIIASASYDLSIKTWNVSSSDFLFNLF